MIQIPIWLIILLIWIVLSILCGVKQNKANSGNSGTDDEGLFTAFTIIISPIWFIVAIIRQVFIEDWK